MAVLYNLARYTVSKQAAGDEPGFEASVNQLFGAELHQRLARTGALAFGRSAALWERGGAPSTRCSPTCAGTRSRPPSSAAPPRSSATSSPPGA
ncbi:hypothetical protein ACFQY7_44485 [Actinomadura luteofluorescens]|uniref:hypothetical protein n=1 Tax=Actinomadura luteofluorescens TaxID=46163 RepID=UPI003637FAF2